MAFDESLNTTHISTNLRNYEAARSGFFTLVVDNLTNLLKPNFKGDAREATDADRIQNAQTVLKLKYQNTNNFILVNTKRFLRHLTKEH